MYILDKLKEIAERIHVTANTLEDMAKYFTFIRQLKFHLAQNVIPLVSTARQSKIHAHIFKLFFM